MKSRERWAAAPVVRSQLRVVMRRGAAAALRAAALHHRALHHGRQPDAESRLVGQQLLLAPLAALRARR